MALAQYFVFGLDKIAIQVTKDDIVKYGSTGLVGTSIGALVNYFLPGISFWIRLGIVVSSGITSGTLTYQ